MNEKLINAESLSISSVLIPPPYGSKNYWESRYRQFYFKRKGVSPPDLSPQEGSIKAKCNTTAVFKREEESSESTDFHLLGYQSNSPEEEPLPGHEWYFSYAELQPLLLEQVVDKLLALMPSLKEREYGFSLLEIGCGDVPIVPNLAMDIAIQTGFPTKAISTDYSATVIEYLKEQQSQQQVNIQEPQESTTNPICNTKDEHQRTDSLDQCSLLTNSRPKKRSKANELKQNVVVQYDVEDATKLSYQESQFDIIIEKSVLDASLADKENGINRCNAIVGEASRVLRMNGAIVLVSHMNANNSPGQKWLEEVVLPGLFQTCSDCKWSIEVHGNSGTEDDEDLNSGKLGEEEEEEGSEDDTNSDESSIGPAVYIIWKQPLVKDATLSTSICKKPFPEENKYDEFLKHIELQFFSY